MDATLEHVLSPIDGLEYSIHLVLPPLPPVPATTSSGQATSVPNSQGLFGQNNPFLPSSSVTSSHSVPSSQGIRHRGPANSMATSFRQSADEFQRQMAALERSLERNRQLLDHSVDRLDTSLSPSDAQNSSGVSMSNSPSFQSSANYPAATPAPFSAGSGLSGGTVASAAATAHSSRPSSSQPANSITTGNGHFASPTPFSLFTQSGADSPGDAHHDVLAGHQSYLALLMQIGDVERQLEHGSVPSVETLFQIRTQLLECQRNRQRDPVTYSFPGETQLQLTQDRIQRIYQCVDRITQQLPLQQRNAFSGADPLAEGSNTIYLVTSSDGTQSLIMPPSTNIIAAPPQGPILPHTHHTAPITRLDTGFALGPQPNDAAIVQNVVRQAVINHQRRQQGNAAGARGIGQYLRRVWLFVRMYFFIYMISDSGTWTRIIFVTLAVLIALLSDTEIPRQLHGLLIAPVQRHLEGLAHMGGPAQQPTNGATGQNANNQPGGPPQDTLAAELWQYLRRAERSLVLLLASLVPGIGERQVQARNAAQAEAERLRQEEQRAQEQEQANTAAPSANNTDTSADVEQPQPQPPQAAS
ncbi:uncharacterized protein N7459_007539 [Penicillium hispanicum]|uniref:uncharacterized protein n=1 Tax=Penicillium hispanicum TaxID=1080232 RepID=UPI002540AE91|nr:uncharacterized protein N7459_007539 [Penicillium hispanicum]KAJ5578575.1 hypothetical protein N7459_007539 [Penicillium hispanicum]